jgi:uncharacterized RDD family membrane protein YckC
MNQYIESQLHDSGLEVAPFKKRLFAYMIDDILISIIFLIILWTPIQNAQSAEEIQTALNHLGVYMIMTQILYHTWFVWQYGASLGKIAMKIKVVEIDTMRQPRLMIALNRAIFRTISATIFYLGFVWALFDPARQTWHDKTASTLVVNA